MNDLKPMIYDCIDAGEFATALKHLNTYAKSNPSDPSINVILEMINDMIVDEKNRIYDKPNPNKVDEGFYEIMQKLKNKSEDDIYNMVLDNFNKMKPSIYISRKYIEENYTKYPLWGAMNIEAGNYEVFRNLAKMLYKKYDDFLWLHERLADAQSKNVLFAILAAWVDLDYTKLQVYKEKEQPEYYDPNIFPRRNDEVFVDLGAYFGDSALSFIQLYKSYKSIYCYEVSPNTFANLKKNLSSFPNIHFKQKAAGKEAGTLYLTLNQFISGANSVGETGELEVDVVSIDEDVKEPISFIKMDIEGSEQSALSGCARHIKENHPHLAISTYHGFDDIIAIPKLIDKIEPGYTFYMRYHGKALPSEYSLMGVWNAE